MTDPKPVGPLPFGGGPTPSLTDREAEVLRHQADGTLLRELAAEMHLTISGVSSISMRVMHKLGARNIAHAVHLGHQLGLLESRPPRHGDHAGFMRHFRAGEEPCDDCLIGEREYRAERKRVRKDQQDNAA
jgi:DNA-binding CsgD family transcriptional regulator